MRTGRAGGGAAGEPAVSLREFERRVLDLRADVRDAQDALRTYMIGRFDAQDRALAALSAAVKAELTALVAGNKETAIALAQSAKEKVDALALATAREREALEHAEVQWRQSHDGLHAVNATAHAQEHALVQLAVDKEAQANERYRSQQNEWRAALSDQSKDMVRRDLLDTQLGGLEKRQADDMAALIKRREDDYRALDVRIKDLEQGTRYQSGQLGGAAMVGGLVLTLVLGALSIALHFAGK